MSTFGEFIDAGGSFGAFNRAAHERAAAATAERRQAFLEEHDGRSSGVIDHDVEIETEQLTEAADGLKKVLDVVGDVPSILEAQDRVAEAVADMGELEGLGEALRAGVRHVRRAQELVIAYGQHVVKLHSERRLEIDEGPMADLLTLLVVVRDACNRWLDYAEQMLRRIS